jgi:arylformamidase
MVYDVSVPVHNAMHVWPGDPPVRLDPREIRGPDSSHQVRVTSILCGSHTGTHVDAPSHMIDGGATLADLGLDALIGPARVVELPDVGSIDRKRLESLDWIGVERVLFRTENSRHWSDPGFFRQFVYLEPAGARFLAGRGVRLVGIDYLSIDRFGSAEHETHFVLLSRSIVILEGLDLSGVPAGDYQLIALPLKLDRADGAPVRAVLID